MSTVPLNSSATSLSSPFLPSSFADFYSARGIGDTDKVRVAKLLSAASRNECDELLTLMHAGLSVNEPDCDNRTALHVASSNGAEDAVRLLLDVGADVNAKDRFGHTALNEAVSYEHSVIAKLLRTRGGEFGAMRQLERRLFLAVAHNDLPQLQHLLVSGVDVSCVNDDLQTPINMAFKEGHLEAVELLLRYGARPDVLSSHGGSACTQVNPPLDDAKRFTASQDVDVDASCSTTANQSVGNSRPALSHHTVDATAADSLPTPGDRKANGSRYNLPAPRAASMKPFTFGLAGEFASSQRAAQSPSNSRHFDTEGASSSSAALSSSAKSITISLRTLTGQLLSLRFPSLSGVSVLDIKRRAEEVYQIPVSFQRLRLSGCELLDSELATTHGISDSSTLHLLLPHSSAAQSILDAVGKDAIDRPIAPYLNFHVRSEDRKAQLATTTTKVNSEDGGQVDATISSSQLKQHGEGEKGSDIDWSARPTRPVCSCGGANSPSLHRVSVCAGEVRFECSNCQQELDRTSRHFHPNLLKEHSVDELCEVALDIGTSTHRKHRTTAEQIKEVAMRQAGRRSSGKSTCSPACWERFICAVLDFYRQRVRRPNEAAFDQSSLAKHYCDAETHEKSGSAPPTGKTVQGKWAAIRDHLGNGRTTAEAAGSKGLYTVPTPAPHTAESASLRVAHSPTTSAVLHCRLCADLPLRVASQPPLCTVGWWTCGPRSTRARWLSCVVSLHTPAARRLASRSRF